MEPELTGRQVEIARVEAALARGPALVCGLPGVGRTRLAMAVAARAPEAVILDCALARGVEALAGLMGVEDAWGPAPRRVEDAPGLVVVEGVDVLEGTGRRELGLWVAAHPQTRWLLTASRRSRVGQIETVAVGCLGEEAARALLAERLGRARAQALGALVGQCAGLPRALVALAQWAELLGPEALAGHLDQIGGVSQLEGPDGRPLEAPYRERLEALSAPARAALEVACGLSAPCTLPRLAALAGCGLGALRELVRGCWLEPRGPEDGAPRFQASPWCGVLLEPRLDAGAHAAWALGDEDVDPAELRAVAAAGESLAKPAQAVEAAARLARRGVSLERELLEGSITLARRLEAEQPLARLLVERARLRFGADDLEGARAALEEALALASAPADRVALHDLSAALARVEDEPGRAVQAYDRALEDARESSRGRLLAERAGALWERGDQERAGEEFARALELCRQAGDVRHEGVIRSNLGVIAHHLGQWEAAATHHAAALELHRQIGHRRFEGIAHLDLGALAHERGQLARARELHERARELLGECGDQRHAALARAALEALAAGLGRAPGLEALVREQARLACAGDAVMAEALELYQRLARVFERAGREDAPAPFDATPYRRRPDEVQLPARLLAATTEALAAGRALLVAPGCARVRAPDRKKWADLSRRDAPRRILGTLVEHRLWGRGPVSLRELFEHGWPGEQIPWDSARNRVHVALSALRRLGLRELLVSVEDGYVLEERALVLRVSA